MVLHESNIQGDTVWLSSLYWLLYSHLIMVVIFPRGIDVHTRAADTAAAAAAVGLHRTHTACRPTSV